MLIYQHIDCATACTAPVNEYFEFEAQPDQGTEYTTKLDMYEWDAIMNMVWVVEFIFLGPGRGLGLVQ